MLAVARDLAIAAAERLEGLRSGLLEQERKADHSLVTNADRAADRLIREGLRRAFPDHAILTEESGFAGSPSAEFVWVVDPLDGTRAYVKGIAGYSVMIGLLRERKPYAGVVVDPWEGHVYEALRGAGAFHILKSKRTRVRVSGRRTFSEMPLVTSTGFPTFWMSDLKARLPCPWVTPINSVGIKVGLLVRQVADIYLNHHRVHYWDTCAPQIILEEAGGIMTLLDGRPLVYDRHDEFQHPAPTLATNGTRHKELLSLLASPAV